MNEKAFIETGVQQMQAGKPEAAEKAFQDALALSPDNPDALHLLGLSRHLAGNSSDAIPPIREAIALHPENPFFRNSLGQAHQALEQFEKALDCFSKATAFKPDFPEALFSMAVCQQKLGQRQDAAKSYRQAIALKPGFPQALCNLGNVLKELGQLEDAIASYNQFIASAPDMVQAETYVSLGDALKDLGRAEEAIESYQTAIGKNPDLAGAYVNLGNAQTDINQLEAANASFEKAHELDPGQCEPFIGLGNVLRKQDRLDDAVEQYEKAVALNPTHPGAHDNLGRALELQGRIEDAILSFHESLRHDGDNAQVHFNLSIALLTAGRLHEGWAEYSWRWKVNDNEQRNFPQPPWQGENLKDKAILVWPEQGIGEEIRFASMIPDLLNCAAHVLVEADPRLVPLFQRSFPGNPIISKAIPPLPEACREDIHFQIPCGDLGKWFRDDFESFPNRDQYLVADSSLRNQLRNRYQDGTTDLLVGVAWSSNNKNIGDDKSLPLLDLVPLAGIPGIRLVDLQYGDTKAQRDAFTSKTGTNILHDDGIDQMADLDAFAAQVAAMDLVVTISNTTAHFAGALGVPTWVMLHANPVACWFLERIDSPWCRSVNLYRKPQDDNTWASVVETICKDLNKLATCGSGQSSGLSVPFSGPLKK